MRPHARAISRAIAGVFALGALSLPTSAARATDLASMLRDAQVAVSAGRLGDAAALYERAYREWPKDLEAARGACELGLKVAGDAPISAATAKACHQRFLATQSPQDLRYKVAALLAEKPKPDLDTIAIAALMAEAARKQAPDQPWWSLARMDIARHLRRADLLATARSDLQPFSATNAVVRDALAEERIGRPSVWVWLLRILVLLGLAGTAVHALVNRNRTTATKKVGAASQAAAALAVAIALLLSSQTVAAAEPMPDMKDGQISRYKIDDAHPEEAVKQVLQGETNPLQLGYLLQDLAARAATAERKDDKPALVRYYRAMSMAAPTSFGPRKECETLEAMGDIPGAIMACRELLMRTGVVVKDYVHFVDLVLESPKPLPDQEPLELANVIAHMESGASTGNLPTIMRCKVALRFEDRSSLELCRTAMAKAPADDPTVISIKWGLAVRDHDREGALALVEAARKAGLDSQQVDKMLQTTNAMSIQGRRRAGVLGGALIIGLALAFFGARVLAASRRRSQTQSPA
jgi:hypothetical protein